MRLAATYLLEPPGAVWALQGAPVWPGLQVVRYWEGHRLHASPPAGKRQSSEAASPAPRSCWAPLHASGLSIQAPSPSPTTAPLQRLCRPQSREVEEVSGRTALPSTLSDLTPALATLHVGETVQPPSRPPRPRRTARQAGGLKSPWHAHSHRIVQRNLDTT